MLDSESLICQLTLSWNLICHPPGDLDWLLEQDPGHGLVQGRCGQGALVCPVALAGREEARWIQGLLNAGLLLVAGLNAEL